MPPEGRESGANYPYTALCLSADRSWGNVVEPYLACTVCQLLLSITIFGLMTYTFCDVDAWKVVLLGEMDMEPGNLYTDFALWLIFF